jgi:DNA-binding MarR family transcriptional regulator
MYPGILIAAARRRIKQAVLARVGDRGLTPQQFWILIAIHESPGITQTGIAARIYADPPTVSRAIAPLLSRGLARAAADPVDRRRARLSLSPAGARLAAKLVPVAREIREAIVAGMSPAEIETLNAALDRVVTNLDRLEQGRAAVERA